MDTSESFYNKDKWEEEDGGGDEALNHLLHNFVEHQFPASNSCKKS